MSAEEQNANHGDLSTHATDAVVPSTTYNCEICSKRFISQQTLDRHQEVHSGENSNVCGECDGRFNTSSALKEHQVFVHQMMVSEEPQTSKCSYCEKAFSSRSEYEIHLKKHSPEIPYFCNDCEKGFARLYQLREHEAIVHQLRPHNDIKLHKCDYCDKRFRFLNKLKIHLRNHTGEKPYSCKVCLKEYSSYTSLKQHTELLHKDESEEAESYICNICDKTFAFRGNFRLHMKLHYEMDPLRCKKCGTQFQDLDQLCQHEKGSHTKRSGLQCMQCYDVFPTNWELKVHKCSVHDVGGSSHLCSECGKVFLEAGALNIHYNLIHHKYRKFACEFCQREFLSYFDLETHLRVHTGETPYICQECLITFSCNESLRKHKIRVHEKTPSVRSDKIEADFSKRKTLQYNCKICYKTFDRKDRLNIHLRIHTGERPFVCPICLKSFHNVYCLHKHERGIHKQEPEKAAGTILMETQETQTELTSSFSVSTQTEPWSRRSRTSD